MTRRTVSLPQPRLRHVRPDLPPGICRIDQPSTRTHGYVARLAHKATPKGWRPRFTKYFGDHTHGGKQAALSAAKAWLRSLARNGRPPRKVRAA